MSPLVGRTPEREAIYDFTIPYLTLHGTLFIRNDNTNIQGLSDLAGQRIAVMKGDNAEEYVRLARLSMSGYTADVIARNHVLAEGVQFIQKPFSTQEIARKLRDVLDERKA